MIYEPTFDMDNTLAEEFHGPGYFEELYISIRQKEQRVYTDEEVAMLPDIYPGHIHYNECQIRKSSSETIINYLAKKNKALKML